MTSDGHDDGADRVPSDPTDPRPEGRVVFVGAGPGAADLITLRGARALGEADVVVWPRSLVPPEVMEHARADAEVLTSDDHTLEDVIQLFARAKREGLVGVAVEAWLWLQFIIVVALFLWAMAKRGPKAVFEAERRSVQRTTSKPV